MNKSLLVFAWIGCSVGSLAANPLITLPTGNFSCSVTVTPRNVPTPDPARPELRYAPALKKITITQVGKLRRDVSDWSDGGSSQLWNITDRAISLMESNTAEKSVYLLRGTLRDSACPPLLRFDSASLSWITDKALAEEATPGKPLHYQAKVVVSAPEDTPVVTATYQAWIDPLTLLPLKFDDGDALYVLEFAKQPPTTPLNLPANVQNELNRWLATSAPRPHL